MSLAKLLQTTKKYILSGVWDVLALKEKVVCCSPKSYKKKFLLRNLAKIVPFGIKSMTSATRGDKNPIAGFILSPCKLLHPSIGLP